MKKAYVIFPTLAMLIFFGFWWNFSSEYEAKLADKARIVRDAKAAELLQEAKDRETAILDAVAVQEQRKQERIAREEQRQKEREERQLAREASTKAFRDKEKLVRQVERLTGDVAVEKEIVEKLEERKRVLVADEAFLRKYVALAETNQKELTQTIQRIAAADAARAAALAAAEAAKKKS